LKNYATKITIKKRYQNQSGKKF